MASKEEFLATLTECMKKGKTKDNSHLKAAETLGKHYGLFTDRLAIGKPERTAEQIRDVLLEKINGCYDNVLGFPLSRFNYICKNILNIPI